MDIKNIMDAGFYVDHIANRLEAFGSNQVSNLRATANELRREYLASEELSSVKGEFETEDGLVIKNLRRVATQASFSYVFDVDLPNEGRTMTSLYGYPTGSFSTKQLVDQFGPMHISIGYHGVHRAFEAGKNPNGICSLYGAEGVTNMEALPLFSRSITRKIKAWKSLKAAREEAMRKEISVEKIKNLDSQVEHICGQLQKIEEAAYNHMVHQ